MTWILLAKHFAYTSNFESAYDESKFEELIPQVSSILHSNKNTIASLTETFARYGILFGVVEKVKAHLSMLTLLIMTDILALS